MTYNDETRGRIIYPERKKQIVDFSGIRYDNITPTDIDGFFEMRNEIFVFYELKYEGVEMPNGQKTALMRVIDAISAAGKKAVLMSLKHNVADVEQPIDMATCICKEYYFNGSWWGGNNRTAKEITDSFLKFAA